MTFSYDRHTLTSRAIIRTQEHIVVVAYISLNLINSEGTKPKDDDNMKEIKGDLHDNSPLGQSNPSNYKKIEKETLDISLSINSFWKLKS